MKAGNKQESESKGDNQQKTQSTSDTSLLVGTFMENKDFLLMLDLRKIVWPSMHVEKSEININCVHFVKDTPCLFK